MIIARSVGARATRPSMGGVRAMISSQLSPVFGPIGMEMRLTPSGTPGSCAAQVSSLPTRSTFASLCSSTKRMVWAPSVGKMATVVKPPIQMASSPMKKCAQFLVSMATRSPGFRPRLFRWAAMRRASFITCAQV